ncbi:MAG: potassium transporter TrkG [Pseudomonadota bacterium]
MLLYRIARLPMFVLMIGAAGVAMFVPAIYGLATDHGASARAFGYCALLTLVMFTLVALATWNHRVRHQTRANLLTMVAFFGLMPALLAWPMSLALPGQGTYGTAVFDMVSAITTTGAPILPLNATASPVHLWRAEVAWLGGFFMWVTAAAVLAPLNLGGFEVSGNFGPGRGSESFTQITGTATLGDRLRRYTALLLPIYASLTAALWLLLMAVGDPPLVAAIHAMSTLSTSGLSPLGGPSGAASGIAGEVVILFFFVFALSRLTFLADARIGGVRSLRSDPEIQLGLLIAVGLPLLLFLRHWIASFDSDEALTLIEGVEGLWGATFTTASVLTTTGWDSASWDKALDWSGLRTPGLLLMGLAIFGGGVATTAGGVKLLRVFALYKHGLREMEKLVQPSSIGGAGQAARRIRREGAYLAWIAFMLFALSIAAVWLALAVAGVPFEDALVLTIASLANCGPLIANATAAPIDLASLSPGVKTILSVAMVVGRIEALAIIALLNPEFWRR